MGHEIKGKIGTKKVSERSTRSDKKVRVNITTTQDTHRKLKKLAISCNMSKTALAEDFIRMCVNHEDIIDWYQNRFNTEDEYRIVIIKKDGKVYY
jgi:hypothetical protein